MNLRCVGYVLGGAATELGEVLSFSVEASIDYAKSQLTVDLSEIPSFEICRMTLFNGDTMLFEGYIDKLEHTISEKGVYYTAVVKSDASLMMENQVGPRYLTQYSSDYLFGEYAAPYGAKINDLIPATIGEMEITAGMTAWQVIDLFCRQTYNLVPIVARGGKITTDIGEKAWTIGGDEHPYSSISKIEDRTGLISKLHYPINDADDYYSKYMVNSAAQKLGVLRERYWKTPTCWKTMRERGASEVIRNSNHELHSYKITLPKLLSVWPGDMVEIKGPIKDSPYYIQSFKISYDEHGAQTKLVLWDFVQR